MSDGVEPADGAAATPGGEPLDLPHGPGAGVDVLDVARLERALARRPGLAARLFTTGEREACAGAARPARHLAARFCVKEAVTKALALRSLRPQDVELVGRGGPPHLRLHGAAAARARALRVHVRVSLAHERGSATAVAILEPAAGAPR